MLVEVIDVIDVIHGINGTDKPKLYTRDGAESGRTFHITVQTDSDRPLGV
jgi:hypothetical protein